MKALSIRQPWAWLIVQGYKDIENRTWKTNFRGEFLIHASKTVEELPSHWKWYATTHLGIEMPLKFQTGGIIGKAELIDCTQDERISDWFEGPWGFVLKNAKSLPFIACKGHLGFFEVDRSENA